MICGGLRKVVVHEPWLTRVCFHSNHPLQVQGPGVVVQGHRSMDRAPAVEHLQASHLELAQPQQLACRQAALQTQVLASAAAPLLQLALALGVAVEQAVEQAAVQSQAKSQVPRAQQLPFPLRPQ